MALVYSGDLYLKDGAKKQSRWEQCPPLPLPPFQRQQLTPHAGTPPSSLSEDSGGRSLPNTRAPPDVEGWRRVLHGAVAQPEGQGGCDSLERQAVPPWARHLPASCTGQQSVEIVCVGAHCQLLGQLQRQQVHVPPK